jgi:hypothetical protein
MRTAYRVLANLVALEVLVQAAAISYAMFGLTHWVNDGGTFTKSTGDSDHVTGIVGFAVHGINGFMVVPLIAVVLFVVSFFAHVPDGTRFAGIVLGTVVVQVLLGAFAVNVPALGWLHGANALVIMGAAIAAATRARQAPAADPQPA